STTCIGFFCQIWVLLSVRFRCHIPAQTKSVFFPRRLLYCCQNDVLHSQSGSIVLQFFAEYQFLPRTTLMEFLFSNVSGLVKLSDLKAPPFPARSVPVDDSVMTQRVGGPSEEEHQPEEEEVVPAVQRRNRKSSSADSGEGKVRGRRQKDFDPTAVGEEEEAELQENKEKLNPATWTQNQQKLLELALQQFPRGTTERWDRIAKVVPGKSKPLHHIRMQPQAHGTRPLFR
ncbi:hypothetical protein XENOCAPTIV_022590, partial [Xenoophorus captivus]